MPAIYHEGSWLGNATDPEVLVKDTVGWTGKNRAYSQTNNAVIAHIENGITYDVSWTGSATVTLKKNSASGATITSGSTSPLSFTADADYELYFGSSATVTNIMVKDSRITDPTYEPYHESVEEEIEQIYADNGVLGAKNLFKLNNVGRTVNGVTFTLNDDNSFTVNGTATADTYFESHIMSAKANDVYIASDNVANPSDSTYRGKVMGKTTGIDYVFLITGKEKKFTVTNTENIVYSFKVKSGQTVNNITFKPMIRLASDPDDTYQPYAMTNRELTEKKIDKDAIHLLNVNLNDVTETGLYYIRENCANSPDNIGYSSLRVQKNSNTNIHQAIFGGSAIYSRLKGSNGWSPWYKFTGTVVS